MAGHGDQKKLARDELKVLREENLFYRDQIEQLWQGIKARDGELMALRGSAGYRLERTVLAVSGRLRKLLS